MKILIVDGSKEQRSHLVQVLGAVTNVIIQGAVADMRSALYAVVEAVPDVIVTGVNLLDGEGSQLIERVRRLARQPSFVVIGAQSEVDRERYLAAGADRYVENPRDSRELQAAIATLRRRPHGSVPPAETLRLLGRITSGVVHDLNNYLHVMEVTQLLLRKHPNDPTLWEQFASALGAMTRLNAMLLGYARGAAVEPALVDVGEVARDMLSVLGRVVPMNVDVKLEIAEPLRPIRGVRPELEQMLLNLIINACDAMTPNGGELLIAVRRSVGGVIVLEVNDTGVGMPRQSLADGVSTKRAGAGLGLSIVHAVVERHAAALRIAPRDGGGTQVVIMFPTAGSGTLG